MFKRFIWYKNNNEKYNIELSLSNYETKTPNIIYKYIKIYYKYTINSYFDY